MAKKKTTRKNEDENVILNHINSKKGDVCSLIDELLREIGSAERIANAPLNQLASAVGTLIDKFSANEKKNPASSGELSHIFEYFKDVK